MAFIPNSNSVVAFQSDPTKLVATVSVVGNVFVGGSILTAQANQSVSGTVQTDVRSSVAVAIISGSIAASFTPPANQSVSGRVETTQTGTVITSLVSTVPSSVIVGASIFGQLPAGTAVLGSVAALQGTTPWLISSVYGNISGSVAAFVVGNASVITVAQSSVAVAIVSGSIAATFTPPANQSVSGTVQTDVRGSVAVAIISGSIAATFTPPANQSVSGTVQAQLQSTNASVITVGQASIAVAIVSGSIAATFTPPANQSVSGTVTVNQGTNPWVQTGSVQGTMSVLGTVPVTQSGTWNVSVVGTGPAVSSILVGVTANTNGSVITTTGYPQTVIQITSGPGASITAALNFEGTIDGTQFVPIQGYNFATNAISSMATVESDWAFNTAGLQGIRARVSNWTVGSITAIAKASPVDARSFATVPIGNQSVSGSLGASIIGQLPAGTAMIGSVVAYQGAVPWTISSVYGNISGSVFAVISGTPNVNTAGSVVAFQGTAPWVIGSIVGTYAEDAAHTTADPGLFVLGVRNDMVTSISSANLDYTPIATDSFGRSVTKPFAADEARIDFVGSIVSTSVTLIAASAVGKRNYITDIMIANTGSVATLVTFKDGSTSILGYTIGPATSGANKNLAMPIRTAPSQDLVFQPGTAVSILYLTIKGYQAP